ncbi:class I SAM-dependent methyltransferase [Paenibacillus urinalis]|uniref:class I SAM-dependent methyltransferase n=1 Tax=Paenibacillus urinalis TaxID=521520 RepID=UPI0019605FDE
MDAWKITNPVFESDQINQELKVSPWSGHRRFIYDFIQFFKPRQVIELGTHYGCSFFAMCQAIKDFNLETEINAVDTWKGDSQAGFYGEEVFEIVNRTIDTYFSEISTKLHRMTFDDALSKFEDSSFDIIHIDGFHEYNAVKHDFVSYLPKLRENGVMIFHDIAANTGYGSSIFWKEIKEKYHSFEFEHSWGLGILFPKGDGIYDSLVKENIHEKIQYYYAVSELDINRIRVKDLENLGLERYEVIKNMDQMINERDTIIYSQKTMLEDRLRSMKEMDAMILERDKTITAQDSLLQERMNAIHQMEEMIKERDTVISSQQALLEERMNAMHQMEEMIKERDTVINSQSTLLNERMDALNQMDYMIKERDEINKSQALLVEERYQIILEMDQMIKERDNTIEFQNLMLEESNESSLDVRNEKSKNNE